MINALGAQTGRMSISHPPLPQTPRAGDARSRLGAELGHALVSADFSQIEFRVAAALADEPTMKANIRAGTDLHNVTAARLFGAGFTDAACAEDLQSGGASVPRRVQPVSYGHYRRANAITASATGPGDSSG